MAGTPTVDIHQAKTQLSRLVDQAAKGREFIISKSGNPMVRVLPIQAPPTPRTLGFLAGQGALTADLKADFKGDIEAMFGAAP